MDHFMEEVVTKKNRTFDSILLVLATIIMVVCAVIGFAALNAILVQFSIPALIEVILMIGIAVLLFFKRDMIKTEYEYTFTNGDLDFAQVYNNKKRKSLGTMRVKNVEAFGPVNSNQFNKLINMPGIKRRNWFLNRGAELYYFYYQKNNEKNIIIFEPSAEMVDYIKKYLPRGVYQE